ncbi:hypothetical protein GCM10022243_67470 [Saccharothrix violaceirubra]|uniref:Uncharacterized protein n=1 Tax=Saccharothrix violaceirubra TaxID=413306 RepID=A0A7W7T2B5_9PSEU|nr:hypothetical protein [Saccharothrix violaceirubra]MBB4965302.1 hypothetical protein [Saccharothrix violaceirubra]
MAGVNRWSRARAAERFAGLGPLLWPSLPWGLAVMALANLAQLLAHWSSYRNGPVVVAVLVGLAGATALVWFRSRTGLGPVAAGVGVLAGPLACVVIATQLPADQLTGLANWVSGFAVAPVLLLPFSRPVEEVVAALAALVVVQAVVLEGVTGTPRQLHAVVLSGGAAAAIGAGTALLVGVMRATVRAGRDLAVRAREAEWERIARTAAVGRQDVVVGAVEAASARLLDDIGHGRRDPASPDVVAECARLAAALAPDLLHRSRLPLLEVQLEPAVADTGAVLVVHDDEDLVRRLAITDRTLLVRALDDVLSACAAVEVTVLPVDGRAHVMLAVTGAGPDTPGWHDLVDRFGGSTTPTGSGLFHDFYAPLTGRAP